MAANTEIPIDRLKKLTHVVDTIENVFKWEFVGWSKEGHKGPEEYFLWAYSETVHMLELIMSEKWKADADRSLQTGFDKLHDRAIALLTSAVTTVVGGKFILDAVHNKLLETLQRINKVRDTGGQCLIRHQIQMGRQLFRIRPKPQIAWNKDGSDLILDDEGDFNRIYDGFCKLQKDPRNLQCEHELYVRRSYLFLMAACRALQIPMLNAFPTDKIFDNEYRPTFLDYPYGSEEFFYGKDLRMGMGAQKMDIGGKLTSDEKEKLDGITKKQNEKANQIEQKLLKNQKTKGDNNKDNDKTKDKTKDKGQDKGKSRRKDKEGKGRKRNAIPNKDDALPSLKKPKTQLGYTITAVNAAADIEDILRDSKWRDARDDEGIRPSAERLVTPTVEIRRTMLVAYYDDFRSIINEIYKQRFGTPTSKAKLPQTAADRTVWLALATKELAWARASVHSLIDSANSPVKAKKLRLAAYKVKLIRAMYTIGLVSGDPGASAKEMKAGLIGRLDDWILYEEAWNAAEQLILERTGITSQLFVTIEGQIKQRNANIARWKEMRAEVEKRPDSGKGGNPTGTETSPDQTTQEETEIGQEEETDEEQEDLDLDLVLSSEEDEEGGGNGTEEEEGEEGGKNGGKEDGEKGREKITDPWDKQLTEESSRIGCILLQNIIQPKLPNAGNYLLDWREERRRRHWFDSLAYTRLTGLSEPEWTHKSPFDPFAADGPPNYRKLPRKTVWDRLQYMWVLTWWRCYQLRELEL